VTRQTRQELTIPTDYFGSMLKKKWSDARAVAELFTEDLVNRTAESKIAMGLLNRG
jgi:hypothetical protein